MDGDNTEELFYVNTELEVKLEDIEYESESYFVMTDKFGVCVN